MAEMEPEVWDCVERFIAGNRAITECRACSKKFSSKLGEVVCSEKCLATHRQEQKGFICHVCSKPCASKEFFDLRPSAGWAALALTLGGQTTSFARNSQKRPPIS